MKQWMLFRRESDNQYYFFNGSWPISVGPNPDKEMIWPYATADHSPLGKPILDVAMEKPRQKLIIINKSRYIVEARGTFVED